MPYKKILYYQITNVLWYLIQSPFMLLHYICCKFRKQPYDRYKRILSIRNELRKACGVYGKQDKDKNWNIVCSYKVKPRSVSVKLRIDSKNDTDYEKFKADIQKYTGCTTSEYHFKKGFGYFDIILPYEPDKKYECDRTMLSIGTASEGVYMWDYKMYPHALIVGDTGQGKSTTMFYIISALLSQSFEVWMIDGKKVDFYKYQCKFDYYLPYKSEKFDLVIEMIESFKNAMDARLDMMAEMEINNYTQSSDLSPVFLIIEEWLVIADEMPKKKKEEAQKLIGKIVRFGRAAGYNCIVTMQRADAEFITTSIRDNFKLKMVLGTPSDTSYDMMFGESLEGLSIGKAWVKQGHRLTVVTMPEYTGIDEWREERETT